MNSPADIGMAVFRRRIAIEMPRSFLADKVGRTMGSIRELEEGNWPTIPLISLYPIAEALDTTLYDLMGLAQEWSNYSI